MIGMKIWFLQERFIKQAVNLIVHQNNNLGEFMKQIKKTSLSVS